MDGQTDTPSPFCIHVVPLVRLTHKLTYCTLKYPRECQDQYCPNGTHFLRYGLA